MDIFTVIPGLLLVTISVQLQSDSMELAGSPIGNMEYYLMMDAWY